MTDLEEEHIPDFITVDGNLIRREEVAAVSKIYRSGTDAVMLYFDIIFRSAQEHIRIARILPLNEQSIDTSSEFHDLKAIRSTLIEQL